MFTIEYVKNMKWCDNTRTMFECSVKYKELNEELPVGVNALDNYPHIRKIWLDATTENYGLIADPDPVKIETQEENFDLNLEYLK